MSLSINSNIASLQAQNNLSQVNKALEQNQERLSSGLRINSAADDAAGLAISDRMNAQIKGMNQASRNASDGISMAQTAEGGLQEITNILQRMRELGVQSANETNTPQDRESLNDEFSKLSSELNRIAESTSFNGKTLLDGTRGTAEFQVGPNTGSENIITVDMNTSVQSSEIGQLYEKDGIGLADDTSGSSGLGDINVDVSGGDSYTVAGGSGAVDLAENISSDVDDVFAEAKDATSSGNGVSASITTSQAYTLNINDATIDVATGDTLNADELATKIEDSTDLEVSSETSSDSITVTDSDGETISIKESGTTIFNTSAGTTHYYTGELDVESEDAVTLSGSDLSNNSVEVDTKGSGLDDANIKTVDDSLTAVRRIDEAINQVDTYRAEFGATQNRLDSTIANLENASQNLTEARSRIQDADIAKEAAEQTQNNVRRQAAASVLTQANQSPQLALQLLGG